MEDHPWGAQGFFELTSKIMWFGNIFQLKGVLRCYYRKQKGLDFPTIYSHDIYFSLDMKIVQLSPRVELLNFVMLY